MRQFRRAHVRTLIDRLSEPPERLVAVFGPRQTGKTVAVQQALSSLACESRYVAVDAPEPVTAGAWPSESLPGAAEVASPPLVRDTRWLTHMWEESRNRAWRSERGFVLVLDEIQKIGGWSDTVKGLWDADRTEGCPLHVVILGSAPLLMQAGLNESLAGRFEPVPFTHWSYLEMARAFGFTLDQYIYFGGYPGAASLVHDQPRWNAYVRNALVEPIIERGRAVDDPGRPNRLC